MTYFEITGQYTTARIYLESTDLEQSAYDQIKQLTNYKAFEGLPLVIMPDAHSGAGCVIGTTVDIKKVINSSSDETGIIPNIIGVDIGCGVEAINLGHQRINYKHLDKFIHENIPAGFNKNRSYFNFNSLSSQRRQYYKELEDNAAALCKKIGISPSIFYTSIGTLGGGNHFIEIGLAQEPDENGNLDRWLSVHSGSRNFGLRVASYYQNMARKHWDEYRNEYKAQKNLEILQKDKELISQGKTKKERKLVINELRENQEKLNAPPKDAEFLPLSKGGKEYLRDMRLAQKYAELNREIMLNKIINFLGRPIVQEVRSVHNYINFDDDILRKGAISAHKDAWVVIPMNMKRGVLIGKGLGNPEWNYSAPHGSGRTMSRAEAKRRIKLNEFKLQMDDVYSTCVDEQRLDEAPDAYKDADMIVKQIDGATVQVIYNVISEYNFKG